MVEPLFSTLLALSNAQAEEPFTLVRYKELTARKPDQDGQTVRVWTIKKDDVIRVNLVEMLGELKLHKHPDAAHSLMVLEGSVRVQVDQEFHVINKGDFISIPAGVPHKYWALTKSAMLVSMDAPYYRQTIPLE